MGESGRASKNGSDHAVSSDTSASCTFQNGVNQLLASLRVQQHISTLTIMRYRA